MKEKLKKHKKVLLTVLSLVILFCILWLLSVTAFKKSGAIPTPGQTIKAFGAIFSQGKVYGAVWSTFSKAALGFALSFLIGGALAALGARFENARIMLAPIMSVIRSVPTLGVTFMLFLIVASDVAAVVVAMLMVVPVIYENILNAFLNMDKKLGQMAAVYKVRPVTRFTQIYLPQILPYVFSALTAGFGLNLKVIIAAEILGIPKNSIGTMILRANNGFDFPLLFAWVLIAVALSFACEYLIKLARRFAIPCERGKNAKI